MYDIINNSYIGGVKMNKVYMCIDLKSFYASVECVERSVSILLFTQYI